MVTIEVLGEDYEVPSSAADTNWAAKQIAFEQALAAGVNAGGAGSVDDVIVTSTGFEIPSDANVNILHSLASSITVTAHPSIAAGSTVGQRLQLFNLYTTGTSIILTNTAGTTLNLKTTSVTLANGDSLELIWDGTQWTEINRDLQLGGSTFGTATVSTLVATTGAQIGDVLFDTIQTPYDDTSGTPGNATINLQSGRCAINTGAATCVITNNRVTTETRAFIQIESLDATAIRFKAVCTANTITVTANANATAPVVFGWWIINNP